MKAYIYRTKEDEHHMVMAYTEVEARGIARYDKHNDIEFVCTLTKDPVDICNEMQSTMLFNVYFINGGRS
tara:strand:+ start:1155 stop:1364 length:210 start_codon:yes stop_codon:yes gene_type:complete